MKTEFPFMRPCNLTPDCSREGKNRKTKPQTQQLSKMIQRVDTHTVAFFLSVPCSFCIHTTQMQKIQSQQSKNTVPHPSVIKQVLMLIHS